MIYQSLQLFAVTGDPCQKSTFFGLYPWYHYLPPDRFDGCDLKNFHFLPGGGQGSDIPLVLIAVVDDLLRIAALVAVGFVIVGAIQLVTSQGNPEDTGRARSTITNALLGLAIAIVSATFVSFLGNALGG
jgi:hypothetical protein